MVILIVLLFFAAATAAWLGRETADRPNRVTIFFIVCALASLAAILIKSVQC